MGYLRRDVPTVTDNMERQGIDGGNDDTMPPRSLEAAAAGEKTWSERMDGIAAVMMEHKPAELGGGLLGMLAFQRNKAECERAECERQETRLQQELARVSASGAEQKRKNQLLIDALEMQIARDRKGCAAVGLREPLETRMRGVRGQGEETERDSENNRIPPRSLEAAAADETDETVRTIRTDKIVEIDAQIERLKRQREALVQKLFGAVRCNSMEEGEEGADGREAKRPRVEGAGSAASAPSSPPSLRLSGPQGDPDPKEAPTPTREDPTESVSIEAMDGMHTRRLRGALSPPASPMACKSEGGEYEYGHFAPA